MAKRKNSEILIPSGISAIVRAICSDYERRARVIKWGEADKAVLERYTELNALIDNALEGIDAGIRNNLLYDVCHGRGYDFSRASPYLAKNTYYLRKRRFVYDIAVGLGLM